MLQCSETTGNVMPFFTKRATPWIVWRNPAMPHGARRAIYRDTVPDGKEYEVLERAHSGDWRLVTVLTIVDGRLRVAAA